MVAFKEGREDLVPDSSMKFINLIFRGMVGDVFAVHGGYNGVAEINNIIVLYPQVASNILINPYGCWDWYVVVKKCL